MQGLYSFLALGRDTVVQRRMRGSVMVVGAGVGGMRAAVDLADSGYKVYLLDSAPSIGGIVSQLGYMFPTHDCKIATVQRKTADALIKFQ